MINFSEGVHFEWHRAILKSPSYIRDLEDSAAKLGNNHHFLDAYTFYYLLRHHLGGHNNYKATWISDTVPHVMMAGKKYQFTITVRNDGWDAWSQSGNYSLGHAFVREGEDINDGDFGSVRHKLPNFDTVEPGSIVTFYCEVVAPVKKCTYDFYYDMVQDGVTWFRNTGNIEWKKRIKVVEDETKLDSDADGVPDLDEIKAGTLYWHPDSKSE